MKYLSAIIGVLWLALTAQAALPQPDLIAQIYFAGPQKISAAAPGALFTNEFSSTEALALRAQTAAKLSAWLAGWLQTNLTATVPAGPAKLRPLLDDLQRSEFLLEIRAAAGGQPEMAIAIKLDAARAPLWQANLKPFFAVGTFKSTGGWLIFDSNPTLQGLGDKLAKEIATPPAGWFELEVNWPRLAQWHPEFKALGLPDTRFIITPSGNNLSITGKFHFPADVALNLDSWRVPTNTIHAPFNSFTAVRGFASWYQAQAWAQPYQLSPAPNQLFVWSLPALAFQTYAAVPVPDAAAAISQVYGRVMPAVTEANSRGEFMTPVKPEMSHNDLVMGGIPFAALRGQPLTGPAGQFLFAELFPNSPDGMPLPPGLLGRLATKDLLFYHWENTADRIPQLLQITQLGLMITKHQQLDGRSAAYKWVRKAGATPGSSETGITRTGPAEFTFLRQGPGLFTAFELFALANWLEAPNFPGCDLNPQPGVPPAAEPQPPERLKAPVPIHAKTRRQHRPRGDGA